MGWVKVVSTANPSSTGHFSMLNWRNGHPSLFFGWNYTLKTLNLWSNVIVVFFFVLFLFVFLKEGWGADRMSSCFMSCFAFALFLLFIILIKKIQNQIWCVHHSVYNRCPCFSVLKTKHKWTRTFKCWNKIRKKKKPQQHSSLWKFLLITITSHRQRVWIRFSNFNLKTRGGCFAFKS